MASAPRPVRPVATVLVPEHGVPTPPDSQEQVLTLPQEPASDADPAAGQPQFGPTLMTRVGDLLVDPSSDLTLAEEHLEAYSSDEDSKNTSRLLLSSDKAEDGQAESHSERTVSLPTSLCTRLPFRRFSPSNPFACSGTSPAPESPISTARSSQHVLQPGPRPQNGAKRSLHDPRPLPPPKKQSIIERGKMTYVFRGQRVTYLDPEDSTDEDLTSSDEEDAVWEPTRPGAGGPSSRSRMDPRANPRFKPKRLFAAELDRRARASQNQAQALLGGQEHAPFPMHGPRTMSQADTAASRGALSRGAMWNGRSAGPRQVTSTSSALSGSSRAPAQAQAHTQAPPQRQGQTSISSFFRAAPHPAKTGTSAPDTYSRPGIGGRKAPYVYCSTTTSSRSTHA